MIASMPWTRDPSGPWNDANMRLHAQTKSDRHGRSDPSMMRMSFVVSTMSAVATAAATRTTDDDDDHHHHDHDHDHHYDYDYDCYHDRDDDDDDRCYDVV